jgi:polar amino acid transport system ATP-binding protein
MPTKPKAPPAVSIHQLSKSYGDHAVLKSVTLDLPARRLSVLIGRSGAGKSTLLRCLNALETPDQGQVSIAGLSVNYPATAKHEALAHAIRARVGMVFQQFHLFPHLTLMQNLLLAPRVAGGREDAPALQAEAEAEALLAKVGLSFHRDHYPEQLSGGQQQRAAIARALAMRPEILLYDEPTSALDPHLAKEVLEVMAALKAEGRTQVMVTHELGFARRYADWVVFLEDGQVIEQGPPKRLFAAPKDPRTRAYVKGAR